MIVPIQDGSNCGVGGARDRTLTPIRYGYPIEGFSKGI